MKQSQRMTAFFSAMMLTFGISGLDMENLEFDENTKEYIAMGLGIILLIVFIILKKRG